MIHLLVGMMAEHSVYVGGLRVNVSDKRCLVIITRAIQNAKEHIEQVTGGHTDIVINQYISPEAHLSCRVQNGAAEFAVYHTSPPELISQLNIEDVGLKYFCQAMEFMAERSGIIVDLKERGVSSPDVHNIEALWDEIDQEKKPEFDSLDEQIAKARAQLEAERTEQGAALNKNNNMGIGIGDD